MENGGDVVQQSWHHLTRRVIDANKGQKEVMLIENVSLLVSSTSIMVVLTFTGFYTNLNVWFTFYIVPFNEFWCFFLWI